VYPADSIGTLDRRQDLRSLQVLRGLAALAVLALHLSIVTEHALRLPGYLPRLTLGEAGVDLFFVISGFIMVHASAGSFGQHRAPVAFLARRIVRIVPLYWAVSGFLLAAFVARSADLATLDLSWPAIAASFVFVPFERPSGLTWPLLQVGWTLNFEMFFYVVFAAALVLRRTAAVAAVSALFAAMVAVRFTADRWPVWFEFLSRPIILEFCFGMVIALAVARGWRLRPAVAVGLIAAACASFLATIPFDVEPWRVIVWGIPAAVILASAVSLEGKFALAWRGFTQLGDASYSLYLVHLPVMLSASRVLQRFVDPAAAPWLCIILLAVIPVAAAFVTYLLFERPVTRWLQKRVHAVFPVSQTGLHPTAGSDRTAGLATKRPSEVTLG
jgi:exopolysaccharide production protein ExoZ